MFAAGTLLGTYEITGLLGAGGMGEVYRGRDAARSTGGAEGVACRAGRRSPVPPAVRPRGARPADGTGRRGRPGRGGLDPLSGSATAACNSHCCRRDNSRRRRQPAATPSSSNRRGRHGGFSTGAERDRTNGGGAALRPLDASHRPSSLLRTFAHRSAGHAADYFSFAYSVCACARTGTSGSASFHNDRKSSYAARAPI
jgi:hypothetical protein